MFHKTRLKLTAWYLLIIMIVSISFSTFIYFGATREFNRIIRIEQFRNLHPEINENYIQRPVWEIENIPLPRQPDSRLIQATKIRALEGLIGINLIIFFLSALAGYFLAGRTLKPIKEMMDEQNRFVTDASHELNTPLTSLKTSIEVNLRDKKLNLEKAKEVLVSNLDDVNNLQSLSDELIKITQYQKLNGNFQLKQIYLSEAVKKAVEKVNPLAAKKHIGVSISVPKLYVNADEKSLIELFVILLDNAIKYSKNGKQVSVSALKAGSKIKIKIEDKGIGIDKDDLPYIFDRFYRADKSRTKQQIVGYGLGLSIAKRIVSLHAGMIEAESVPKKGTIFTITLPEA